MTRGSEVEIILLFLMLPHDAHNCCFAPFQGSPLLMRMMAYQRSILVMYIYRWEVGGEEKKGKLRSLPANVGANSQ